MPLLTCTERLFSSRHCSMWTYCYRPIKAERNRRPRSAREGPQEECSAQRERAFEGQYAWKAKKLDFHQYWHPLRVLWLCTHDIVCALKDISCIVLMLKLVSIYQEHSSGGPSLAVLDGCFPCGLYGFPVVKLQTILRASNKLYYHRYLVCGLHLSSYLVYPSSSVPLLADCTPHLITWRTTSWWIFWLSRSFFRVRSHLAD